MSAGAPVVLRSAVRRAVTAAGALLGSSVVAGLSTYAYLVVVARATSDAQWSSFSLFWSLALFVGFGFFLPIEQEGSAGLRSGAGPGELRRLLRTALRLSALVVAGVAALSPILLGELRLEVPLVVALLGLAAVSGPQFAVRGALLALGHRRAYAVILVSDCLGRVGLAVILLLSGVSSPAAFAAALVGAIGVSHVLALVWLRRQVVRRPAAEEGVTGKGPAGPGWAVMLPASLCAQALQNGGPVVVGLFASVSDEGAAGRFLAAFTLARIPLFLSVPVQSALIPPMTAFVRRGEHAALRAMMVKVVAIALVAAPVLGLVAAVAGRPVLALMFGSDRLVPALDLALMAAGVCVHLALVVLTQAMVAMGLRPQAATAWVAALLATLPALTTVPDLFRSVEVAFLVGSVVGVLLCTVAISRSVPAGLRSR